MLGGEALDLRRQRRPGRTRGATERALQRGAQVDQRGLHLLGARSRAPASSGRRRGEHERDAEEPLHDAVVDVAREVDALLELARALGLVGRDPRARRERERLAERPQQVAPAVVQRGVLGQRLGQDHAGRAPARGHRDVDERVLADELGERGVDLVRLGRADLDHAVLRQRTRRHRRGLHADVHVDEGLERHPVRAGRAHLAQRRVVAEDDRPAHAGDVADRLGQARVEPLAVLVVLDPRQDVDQQLDRRDRLTAGCLLPRHHSDDRRRGRPRAATPPPEWGIQGPVRGSSLMTAEPPRPILDQR